MSHIKIMKISWFHQITGLMNKTYVHILLLFPGHKLLHSDEVRVVISFNFVSFKQKQALF
jgi:hypothetical protein